MDSKNPFSGLPDCAANYIRLVVKKMRWRRKVRADVQAELTVHFEDALKNCKSNEEKEKTARKIISEFGDAKMLGVLARRAKKRCRPLWQKIIIKTFQTCGIIIGLFILYVFWFLSGRPKITVNYIELANKIMRPQAADESQNAAPYYEKAAAMIEPNKEQSNELLAKAFGEANETDIARMRQWLDKNQEALTLIEQGLNKPYFWQTFQGDPNRDNCFLSVRIPNLTGYRALARGLCWRTYLSADDKQYDKTFADLLMAYKFGKQQKNKGVLVQSLVGIAIEAQSTNTARTILDKHDDIKTQQLESLYNNLQALVSDENFVIDMSLEKFFMYDEIQRCFTESRFGFEHIYLKRLNVNEFGLFGEPTSIRDVIQNLSTAFNVLFTHPGKQQTRQLTDAYYDFYGQIAATPPYKVKGRDLENEAQSLIKGNILLEILAPTLQKLAVLSWRNKTDIEGTLAIIEIVRFKEEKSRLPDDLQELVTAGYLKSLPMDPFSDKPLVYKKTQAGFMLYSVGQDFTDNGGKIYQPEPGKYKIWPPDANASGSDAVFWPVMPPAKKI